jgi:hypothetical protein
MFRVSLVSLLGCVGLAVVARIAPAGFVNDMSMVGSSVAALICIGAAFFGIAERVAPAEDDVRPRSGTPSSGESNGRRAA